MTRDGTTITPSHSSPQSNHRREASSVAASQRHLLASQGAAALSTCCLHPLDVVRTRIIAQDHTRERRYSGGTYRHVRQAISQIYAVEGLHAFYRGVHISLMGSVCAWGVYMYTYQSLNQYATRIETRGNVKGNEDELQQKKESDHPEEKHHFYLPPCRGLESTARMLRPFMASVIASVTSAVVCNPIWLMKTRMELAENATKGWENMPSAAEKKRNYTSTAAPPRPCDGVAVQPSKPSTLSPSSTRRCCSSPFSSSSSAERGTHLPFLSFRHGVWYTIRHTGVCSLWRGTSAQVLLGIPNAMTLPLYEVLRRQYHRYETWSKGASSSTLDRSHLLNTSPSASKPSVGEVLLCSVLSKSAVCVVSHPILLLKIRLQDHRARQGPVQYLHLSQALRASIALGGVRRGVFRGLGSSLLHTVPRAALFYVLYEQLLIQSL